MFDLEMFIKENEGFVYSLTHNFRYYSNKEDLYQAGMMGLIYAYQKYDPSFGVKFTTYAYPYILGEMKKLVREDKGVKVSRDIQSVSLHIEKAITLLSQKLMKMPSIKEISEFLQIPEDVVEMAIRSKENIYSLDEAIKEDSKVLTLADFVEDKRKRNVDDLIALKQELLNLSPFEKKLIEQRYFEDYTQSETAKSLGLTQVQVSRKEKKILEKIKQNIVA